MCEAAYLSYADELDGLSKHAGRAAQGVGGAPEFCFEVEGRG